jgi:tetratricopeptide (TPR) repeat protein
MGKWKDAADEYRAVLAKDPSMPGIHYRLGRLLLSEPDPASPTGDASQKNKQAAKIEFQEELKIDPNNAGAEFVLGELARQDEQWPEAIAHFRKATQLNAGFADAYIGLGRALVAANRAQEAIAPLETAIKLQPGNPAAHFQLATAYLHTGRKQDAEREFLAQKQAADRTQQMKDEIKRQVSGDANQKPLH